MKKAFTLIELLVIIVILFLIVAVIYQDTTRSRVQIGSISTGYGHNLQRLSIDRTSGIAKYHFQDVSTGEKFWSYDSEGAGILNRE
jgi:hypothetical protein